MGWSRHKPVGMPYKFNRLAEYNGEVGRGLVHTREKDLEMAALQAEFKAYQIAQFRAEYEDVELLDGGVLIGRKRS